MRAIFFLFCFLPISLIYAASCTLNFSVADYNSVYQAVGYNFIPLSSVDPQANGGVQFSAKTTAGWIPSEITVWKNNAAILVDNKKNCSSLYKAGVVNVSISYADLASIASNEKETAKAYCLLGLITPLSGSQTVALPSFPNALYWQPCAASIYRS